MSLRPLTLVKVGGSLLDWQELPRRLEGFLEERRASHPDLRHVLLCGGGCFVDCVRRFDRVHRLGDVMAHRLAIQAMDLASAILLCTMPQTVVVDRVEQLDEESSDEEIPLLLPGCIIDDLGDRYGNPLPPSWDVTSDTIAAWVAGQLKAASLVLLKSASLPPHPTRELAAQLKLVDPFFPLISSALARVEYLNLRDPSAVAEDLP